jgi:hypothetical protein
MPITALPVDVSPAGAYTAAQHRQHHDALHKKFNSMPVSVAEFGALGTSNDTATWQAALDWVAATSGDARGRALTCPPVYSPVDQLNYSANVPLYIQGEIAVMGNISGSTGVTLAARTNGQVIFEAGDGTTIRQEGVLLRHINFAANGKTGVTGFWPNGINNWGLEHCGFRDMDLGVLQEASGSTDNAWSTLYKCVWWDCKLASVKCFNAFGLIIDGGAMHVPDIAGNTAVGLLLDATAGGASQSIKTFGLFMDVHGSSSGNVYGYRFLRGHDCAAYGGKLESLKVGAEFDQLDGGDSTAGAMNTLDSVSCTGASTAKFAQVNANATDTRFRNCHAIDPLGTGIVNAGTRTSVEGGRYYVTTPFTETTPMQMIGVSAIQGGVLRSTTRLGWSSSDKHGFFGATPIVKPTVTGSKAGNAALASALTALANLGLLTDSST